VAWIVFIVGLVLLDILLGRIACNLLESEALCPNDMRPYYILSGIPLLSIASAIILGIVVLIVIGSDNTVLFLFFLSISTHITNPRVAIAFWVMAFLFSLFVLAHALLEHGHFFFQNLASFLVIGGTHEPLC
jgi:hypothetical protein